ncbi:hypothetical protein ACXR0O_25745 [Verrucomicrobiota bacterium sgz303538]
MTAQKTIHSLALLALVVLAVMSLVGAVSSHIGGPLERTVQVLVAVAIWGLFIRKIWKKPRKWGLGVGIFLLLMLGFQTYLWRLAIANPRREELGVDDSVLAFVLYEFPIVIGSVCCMLLRWYGPMDFTDMSNLNTRPELPGQVLTRVPPENN